MYRITTCGLFAATSSSSFHPTSMARTSTFWRNHFVGSALTILTSLTRMSPISPVAVTAERGSSREPGGSQGM